MLSTYPMLGLHFVCGKLKDKKQGSHLKKLSNMYRSQPHGQVKAFIGRIPICVDLHQPANLVGLTDEVLNSP
ncbi:hypothetical protein DPMN_088184 [Dreissena polymorpha]|uniref:Uncharacterized protein n=1 Tax=Dreissena polymorpha TaxID=45954 RepID=A0A9D4QWA4_DREPO|nr:hypothetical protein DPMN_088184 [Dreissena polymorpha]